MPISLLFKYLFHFNCWFSIIYRNAFVLMSNSAQINMFLCSLPLLRYSNTTVARHFKLNMTSFSTTSPLESGENYGPDYGIYIGDASQSLKNCETGTSYLYGDYVVDSNLGVAFEYDCMDPSVCQGSIIG